MHACMRSHTYTPTHTPLHRYLNTDTPGPYYYIIIIFQLVIEIERGFFEVTQGVTIEVTVRADVTLRASWCYLLSPAALPGQLKRYRMV